ncbi:MAG TPA: LLM class flavin-dependent oxidoreductase [Candidatus Limnocylindria bacterium]|nr:LLM class flavin-dependent oxidoreductase [Candidatus Limnocylindria bacterium]
MSDFGIHGFPDRPDGVDRMSHYRHVLDALPQDFSTVWISDHMQAGEHPTVEAWTTLTYLAATLPRFRLGTLVLSQSYRNPALLAKMAATFQELSGGRLILGMGAGWQEDEYRAYGYEYPSGGVRVAQLSEAIQVLRALWTESPATFAGTHYQVRDAFCAPRPDPPIPIMIGTNGPKALGVVAQHADWWCWDGPWDATYREPYERLREHCETIGRPFDDILKAAELTVWLPDDPSVFEATYAHPFYPSAAFHVLGPKPEDVIREIRKLVDVGVSHFPVNFADMATLHRFCDEVLPGLRT